MSKYSMAPEFASQPRVPIPSSRLLLRGMNFLLGLQMRGFAWGDSVEVRTHEVTGEDGHVFSVLEISPQGLGGQAPALIDYHGGGFFFSHAPLHLKYAERYALEAKCRVFFTDYRLSIHHPFPEPFDDCYATLAWVHAKAAELGVDPARVAVIGDSAGGALAAGVAQKAFDSGENPVCAQILIYPVTDHESKTESARVFTDTPMWKSGSNKVMWDIYLAGSEYEKSGGSAPVPQYAAPLHRDDFAGLPPALVEVAEFDPLRDEGRLYAEALEAAGVSVEFGELEGGIHGYDLVEGSPMAEAVAKDRIAAIQRFFSARA